MGLPISGSSWYCLSLSESRKQRVRELTWLAFSWSTDRTSIAWQLSNLLNLQMLTNETKVNRNCPTCQSFFFYCPEHCKVYCLVSGESKRMKKTLKENSSLNEEKHLAAFLFAFIIFKYISILFGWTYIGKKFVDSVRRLVR